MGVWIETTIDPCKATAHKSHPIWVCGLKLVGVVDAGSVGFVTPYMGVWIETTCYSLRSDRPSSHPIWVCGLKQIGHATDIVVKQSHPIWVCGLKHTFAGNKRIYRNVTPYMGVWIETRI